MTKETTQGHPEDSPVPAVATMAKPLEEVDGALLAEAQKLLSLNSTIETINQALAELIQERRRRHACESQLHRFEAGQFVALQPLGDRL